MNLLINTASLYCIASVMQMKSGGTYVDKPTVNEALLERDSCEPLLPFLSDRRSSAVQTS